MLKVTVLYPNGEGRKFDMDYYLNKHMPLVASRCGAPLHKYEVDEGLAGGAPGSKPPFVAAVHMYFDSADTFGASFGPHADEIMKDIPNYTDAQPVIQLSTVKKPA